ncbi:MAG: VTT domain-containing protein [Candidatus Acidiferrales bacterium]
MIISARLIAAATPTAARSMRRWIVHLGGLGLIPLGLLDNSPIPIPGSMDIVLMILCVRGQESWIYYALMAVAGSVIGGFVTYRLARKGGKGTLKRRFPPRQMEKINKLFERWGFGAVAIPAFLPPPFPFTPFLVAAGAMQYPVKKFLVALALGRIPRYTLLAYLSARYGRKIIRFLLHPSQPFLLAVVALAVVMAFVAFLFWRSTRRAERPAL